MNIEVFRTLLLVEEHGNFRLVAEAMNLSQPAIVKRVHVLEALLGAELVRRCGREMVLTSHGRSVLPHARRIVRGYDDLLGGVGGRGRRIDTIRLGVVDTILYTWLPEFLDLHRHRHPDVEFEVSSSPTLELVEDLRAQRIDMAIMLGPSADRPFVDVPLGEMEVALFGRCGDPGQGTTLAASAGMPLDAEAVSSLRIVTFPKGSKPCVDLLAGIERLGLARAPRIGNSSSVLTMRDMAERGIAVATLPVLLADAPGLCRIDIGLELPNLVFSASWNPLSAHETIEQSCRLAAEVATATDMGRGRSGTR